MSKSKVVLGTLAGLAAGAIAGILLAPEKGSKTRSQILGKGENGLSELKSVLNGFTDSLSAKFDTTKRETEHLAEKGKSHYDSFKKEVKNTVADIDKPTS